MPASPPEPPPVAFNRRQIANLAGEWNDILYDRCLCVATSPQMHILYTLTQARADEPPADGRRHVCGEAREARTQARWWIDGEVCPRSINPEREACRSVVLHILGILHNHETAPGSLQRR
jgi:hypothetical protein